MNEGHQVKVTGAKKCQVPYSISNNSGSVEDKIVKFFWGFWPWQIEWCDCRLCHMTGSDHA